MRWAANEANQSLGIDRRLAAADPGSAEARRDVSGSLNKLGDVKLQAGDQAGALAAYQESLDIARKLAAADPGRAEAQRDLSVSLKRLDRVPVDAPARSAIRSAPLARAFWSLCWRPWRNKD